MVCVVPIIFVPINYRLYCSIRNSVIGETHTKVSSTQQFENRSKGSCLPRIGVRFH